MTTTNGRNEEGEEDEDGGRHFKRQELCDFVAKDNESKASFPFPDTRRMPEGKGQKGNCKLFQGEGVLGEEKRLGFWGTIIKNKGITVISYDLKGEK